MRKEEENAMACISETCVSLLFLQVTASVHTELCMYVHTSLPAYQPTISTSAARLSDMYLFELVGHSEIVKNDV